jgi:cupin fold WbuC family metalloprotein
MSGAVQLIDSALIEATLARAMTAPRGRINHNLHPDMASNPHRFLNAWTRGSYAAPHRHLAVPKPESFVVLRGELALFVFDDAGTVTEKHVAHRCRADRNGSLLRSEGWPVRRGHRQRIRAVGSA